MANGIETRKRSLTKTASWRGIASLDTLLISFFVVWILGPDSIKGAGAAAGMIAAVEVPSKLALYYFHERVWQRLKWGILEPPSVQV